MAEQAPHRLHLNRLYLERLHQAVDWHQALAVDPADEPAHLALVQRYVERGDRVAALRQLDQLDDVVREELGGRTRPSRDDDHETGGARKSRDVGSA